MIQNKSPKISIIILNWNGWEDTIECLESLYSIDYPNYEVILVDNFSTNQSVQKIKDWSKGKVRIKSTYLKQTKCTHNLTFFECTKGELENGSYVKGKDEIDKLPSNQKLFLLKNDKNYGFAGGNNVAIKQVIKEKNSEYIFLLNNDTIIDKDLFRELLEKKEEIGNKKIGLIGPKIFNYYTNNHQIKSFGKINKYKKVDGVSGAAFLVDIEVLKSIGLFDEYFFLYGEDTDLCLRIGEKYNNYYIQTENRVYHKVEGSSKNISEFKIKLHVRNLFILFRRYKQYKFKDLFLSIVHLTYNNISINFFKTIYYVSFGIFLGVVQYFKNPKPKY